MTKYKIYINIKLIGDKLLMFLKIIFSFFSFFFYSSYTFIQMNLHTLEIYTCQGSVKKTLNIGEFDLKVCFFFVSHTHKLDQSLF